MTSVHPKIHLFTTKLKFFINNFVPFFSLAYEVLSDEEKRRVYDQMDHLTNPDHGRERKFKKDQNEDMGTNPFINKEAFHSKRGFQHFSLEELLHTLRMDDDFFMGEQPAYEGWSFNFGPEDGDETVLLSDLFDML